MPLIDLGPDKYYKIEHTPVSNAMRFNRLICGPQTHIDIDEADYTYTDSNSIFVNTSTGSDSTGTGTQALPYKTLLKGANSCTSAKTKVIVLNTAFSNEDLTTFDNDYFAGYYAATGITPTYTTRTLGYTPSDSNTIYVAKTGSDANAGTAAAPVLTLTGATGAISKVTASKKSILINDSGTYSENTFTFTGNFTGLYAGLGCAPVIQISGGNATFTLSPTTFETGAIIYNTATCILTTTDFVIAYVDDDDSNQGKFARYDSDGVLQGGSVITFETGSTKDVSICSLPTGDFVIAYVDVGDSNKGKFARYDSSGVLQGSITEFESGSTTYVTICSLLTGDFVIAYRDAGDSNHGKFVRYDCIGVIVGSITTFNSQTTSWIAICCLTTGDFIIAFVSDSSGYAGYFKRYDSNGILQGSIECFEYGSTSYTAIASLPTGDFVIAYRDAGDSNKGKFARYNSSGAPQQTNVTFEAGATYYISICSLSTGEFIIVYVDSDDSSNGKLVRYNSSGTIQGSIVTFEYGSTALTSCGVITDVKYVIAYADVGDSTKGKFIFNTNISYVGITISVTCAINGITFDGNDNYFMDKMFLGGTGISTIKFCEIKNVTNPNDPNDAAFAIAEYNETNLYNNIIRSCGRGVYILFDKAILKNNLFNNCSTGYAARVIGASTNINIQHNTFFRNYGGLYLQNSGVEIVKNNIFCDNDLYDIFSTAAIGTSYSIITGNCYNVTQTSCISANPLFVNEGEYDEDDVDLMLKLRIMGDFADSPAYLLADDTSPERDAGAWDIIPIGTALIWSDFTCEKPDTGIARDIEFVGAIETKKKSGDVETSKDGIIERVIIKHEGMRNAEFENWLLAIAGSSNMIRFYPNPTTSPDEYQLYRIVYKTTKTSAKAWICDTEFKQEFIVELIRKFELS